MYMGNLETKRLQSTDARETVRTFKGKSCSDARETVRTFKGKSCCESVINSWFQRSIVKCVLFGKVCEMAVAFGH